MNAHAPSQRQAFTLVEMLTVIAIITLLIGILVPSLSAARNAATKTAVQAQLQAISTGNEMFRNDEGEYAKSNPFTYGPYGQAAAQTTAMNLWEVDNLNGAHLIVDAMIGRDSLGYDPKPGTGPGSTVDSRWSTAAGTPPTSYPRARRNPYIKPEGISVATAAKPPQDAFGPYSTAAVPNPYLPQPDASDANATVFVDKFGFPILYYRARPNSTPRTEIIQTNAGTTADANISDGVYDGRDNFLFTSPVGRTHRIADATSTINYGYPLNTQSLNNNFAEFIRSYRATSYVPGTNPAQIDFPRPVNGETFLLLTPGKDGIYGNLDDVGNWTILSEER